MSGPRRQGQSAHAGLTLFELLTVALLLTVLVLAALPSYFTPETDARTEVDRNNINTINASLALYRLRRGACPPTPEAFALFLDDPAYFPDGRPLDPWSTPPSAAPYVNTYSAVRCRVQLTVTAPRPIDHNTGLGH